VLRSLHVRACACRDAAAVSASPISNRANGLQGVRQLRTPPVAQPLRFAGGVTRPAPRSFKATAANAPRIRIANGGDALGGSMNRLISYVKSFVREDEGQDLLEYALLVALIALVAVVAVTAAGGSVRTIFENIAAALANAA
jgi:pilus assembly protein Flp/PilA